MKTHSLALTLGALLCSPALPARAADEPALKDVFAGHFLAGVAINDDQCSGAAPPAEIAIIKKNFNCCTPENVLKWEVAQPESNRFNFEPSDRYVAFGETNHMYIIGHNLVWHSQTPRWVFRDGTNGPISREALIERMHDHIARIVGRYKGRIKGWDVVNEALAENGSLRQSPWLKIIGEDYLKLAYQFAHEADPEAELYYNEYGMEKPAKRAGAVALIKKLQAEGIPIAGVGIQGHYKMGTPTTNEVNDTINEMAALGVKVMITELDVDVVSTSQSLVADVSARDTSASNQYTNSLPPEMEAKLAARYADLFKVFAGHKAVTRVTFWGVTDGDSWLNSARRKTYPLLFGRDNQPKPAFDAVVAAVRETTAQ